MKRKKNPFSIDYSKYLSGVDSFELSFPEWLKKIEYEDSDRCDNCGSWIGLLIICPECKQ